MSSGESSLMYICIMTVSILFAFGSQKGISTNNYDSNGNPRFLFKPLPFFLSLFIPWFFVAFTKSGVDYNNYYNIINSLTWRSYATSYYNEPGMNIVFLLIKDFVGGDADITIFWIKTITVIIIGSSIYVLRNQVRVAFSIMAYLFIFYLPSFYLISMCFAGAFVFFALALYLKNQKFVIPILIILLAAQFHNSCYLFLPVFIACIVVNSIKSISSLTKILLTIAYIVALTMASTIFSFFQKFSSFHYDDYMTNTFSGSGLYILVLYIPLFWIIFNISKKNDDEFLNNNLFVYALSSCFFNILSYQFRVIERVEILLLPLYMFFIPQIFIKTRILRPVKRKTTTTFLGILIMVYIVFRGVLVFQERVTVESGLANYVFFNPFLK